MGQARRLCLENVLALGKVDLALVLALGDAGALVLLLSKREGGKMCQWEWSCDGREKQRVCGVEFRGEVMDVVVVVGCEF